MGLGGAIQMGPSTLTCSRNLMGVRLSLKSLGEPEFLLPVVADKNHQRHVPRSRLFGSVPNELLQSRG